jgi:hypothetical protein
MDDGASLDFEELPTGCLAGQWSALICIAPEATQQQRVLS